MTTNAYWWIALGGGLAVIVVAVALLEIFLRRVHRVERGAGVVWASAKRVARNTATTWMLSQTSERLDVLTEEALRHDTLLRRTTVSGDSR